MPFRSSPADFGQVTISSIITVLLTHYRNENIEMLGDVIKGNKVVYKEFFFRPVEISTVQHALCLQRGSCNMDYKTCNRIFVCVILDYRKKNVVFKNLLG